MRPNIMFDRLRKGEVLLGLCNMYPAAGIIEGMCAGWDFVWIDGQHGELSYDSILHAMHASGTARIETLVRVPSQEGGVLGMYADLAPSAIMVPMVNNVEEAKRVVYGLRFPPLGERSYGGRRVIDLDGRDFYRERELLVVAQVETLESVSNVDAIINTNGIDALFFGPDDMKVRMGLPINTAINENDQLRNAMQKTVDACRKAGKIAGCVGATPAAAKMAAEMGYQILIGGGDIAFLRVAAADRLVELRKATGSTGETVKPKAGTGVYGG